MTEQNIPRPLGPNEGPPPSLKDRDGNITDQPYVHQSWPAWRYNPETGVGQIFESAEEVPEGWTNIPPGTSEAGDEPVVVDVTKLAGFNEGSTVVQQGGEATELPNGTGGGGASTDDDDDDDDDADDEKPQEKFLDKDELVALGQARLGAILMQKNDALAEDAQIEFLPAWPKVKLADAILANGGYSTVVQED